MMRMEILAEVAVRTDDRNLLQQMPSVQAWSLPTFEQIVKPVLGGGRAGFSSYCGDIAL